MRLDNVVFAFGFLIAWSLTSFALFGLYMLGCIVAHNARAERRREEKLARCRAHTKAQDRTIPFGDVVVYDTDAPNGRNVFEDRKRAGRRAGHYGFRVVEDIGDQWADRLHDRHDKGEAGA